MKITFLGAAETVTGSCFLVETGNTAFLVDCGMFQGSSGGEAANETPFPFSLRHIDFVLLTHAHIDHSGRIPKLWVDGYRNGVYATRATADLCGIMLPDSGHIQEMEAEWDNRKRRRSGRAGKQPLYTHQDALDSLKLFKPRRYDEPFNPAPDVRAVFRDAGHILGSSILEVWVDEGGRQTKAVFSGDLGYKGKPIIRDPAAIEEADVLVMESTYGDRLHEDGANKMDKLVQIINDTAARGGNVVIPSFAVGRTQELLYELNNRREDPKYRGQPFTTLPVYIDSPLAVSATEVFRRNTDCFDEEARKRIESGDNPLEFPNLHFVGSTEESKSLNESRGSKIIISASGMCDAGRIKHHLKHNLWRRESTVLFVGFQAQGTLGRQIADGAVRVKLFGEDVRVMARIEKIEGFSGHADRDDLLDWLGHFKRMPKKIVLVHGESDVQAAFAKSIRDRFGAVALIPPLGGAVTTEDLSMQADAAVQKDTAVQAASMQEENAPKAAPAVHPDSMKLAVMEQMDTIGSEFAAYMDELRDDLRKTSVEEVIREIAAKVQAFGRHLRQYKE